MNVIPKSYDAPHNLRILIVEDDPNDLALTVKKIHEERSDAQIDTARTIYQAYKILVEGRYDYVLLDLNLPDGFGIETVRETKRYTRKAEIVVTTTLGNHLTREEAQKAGANRFFLKSELFERTVDQILGL